MAILVYIAFRFEWRFGVGAIIALVHDVVTTIGLFAVTQLEFNLATVAAILTIAGYSINDTVVIYDRVRETLRKYKKLPLPELLNMAINSTLSRTTMTSVTIVESSMGAPCRREFADFDFYMEYIPAARVCPVSRRRRCSGGCAVPSGSTFACIRTAGCRSTRRWSGPRRGGRT